jgi:DNA polymerase I-like protein with 3'-5' exonuclease and polymerase domains
MTKRGVVSRGGLFDALQEDEESVSAPPWEPEELPDLDGTDEVELDFETDGLAWWAGARPIGFALGWEGRQRYFSWGHKADVERHDEETCKRWFREQLKGKRIANANTKTEIHFAEAWLGESLENYGVTFTDVQHQIALLDDHRRQFSQDVLCQEFLPNERKVEVVNGVKIEPSRMAYHHPGIVAVRAKADVRQVRLLVDIFAPRLKAEGLERVLALENECQWATCEMERNALLVDVPKLRRWAKECRAEYERLLREIHSRTGLRFNPDSGEDWNKLFKQRGIPNTEMTRGRVPKQSFTDAVLLGAIKATDDEVISMGRHAGKLADLLSKYLDKWAATVGEDGLLRFNLHQLRGDDGGTISGRFASSAIDIGEGRKVGANIQAILALEKQQDLYGPDWIIRELIIPADGKRLVSADAEQIEYRLFAHYAGNPRVIAAYRENPRMSFHKFVHGLLDIHNKKVSYKSCKNLNFATIYGAGAVKIGVMLGEITQGEADELNRMDAAARNASDGMPVDLPSRRDPRMRGTMEIRAMYDRELPEVGPLLKKTTALAVERGWVMDLMGRRARFIKKIGANGKPYVDRPHKSLNAVIQGGAGSIMKKKMIEAHKAAPSIGFLPRITVHDQLVGDGEAGTREELGKVLDTQSFPLKVPILWATSEGANWKECDEK